MSIESTGSILTIKEDPLVPSIASLPLKINLEGILKGAKEGAIHLLYDPISRNELFEKIDGYFNREGITKKGDVYRALVKREKEKSTAFENNVAIPDAEIRGLGDIYVYIAIYKKSCQGFGREDGEEPNLVFTIIQDPNKKSEYNQCSGHIARLLISEKVRSKLLEAEHPEDAYDVIKKFSPKYSQP